MDLLRQLIDYVLHLDAHLAELVQAAGAWTYGVLALVVFCETGLVVTPFLPGDSLLFAAGSVAALPEAGLNVHLLAVLLIVAAVVGDAVNYAVGKFFGLRVAARFVKAQHLEQTRAFFERHGGKAVVLARFVPIVRTLAPFVAGMGAMEYRRFFAYNVLGGVTWVVLFLYAGFFFGNIPAVKENFSLVIIGVIVLSLVPVGVEWLRHRRAAGRPSAVAEAVGAAAVVAEEEVERAEEKVERAEEEAVREGAEAERLAAQAEQAARRP